MAEGKYIKQQSERHLQHSEAKTILQHCGVDDAAELENCMDWIEAHLDKLPPYHQLIKQEEYKKTFQDPIHGPIELDGLLISFINTPEFYRLKELKQLGGKVHVYPGATHTRFEHSIGVSHIAGKFIDHLLEKQTYLNIGPNDKQCIKLAGLCHDLGHGPFSHVFEHVIKEIKPGLNCGHEVLSLIVFRKILRDRPEVLAMFVLHGLNVKDVYFIEEMIHYDPPDATKFNPYGRVGKEKQYLYDIVANKSSGIDVDKWDYFARDCYQLGITNDFDSKRCLGLSRVVKVGDTYRVGFHVKELDNIYGMFRTRCTLHRRACMHKTAIAYEIMIADVLIKAKECKLFERLHSEQPDYITVKKAINEAFKLVPGEAGHMPKCRKLPDMKGYLALRDSVLQHIKWAKCEESDEGLKKAKEIIKRIEERRHYRLVDSKKFPKSKKEQDSVGIERILRDKTNRNQKISTPNFVEFCRKSSMDIDLDAVCIEIITIAFASEKKDDPVEEVYFYDWSSESDVDPPEGVPGKLLAAKREISKLVIPVAFAEWQIRLYKKKEEWVQLDNFGPIDPRTPLDKEEEKREQGKLREKFNEWIKSLSGNSEV